MTQLDDLPETLGYRMKKRLLGAPMTNDQLKHERLSKTIAFGVLAPDCISSAAYGTEEMLIGLFGTAAVAGAGLAAFNLLLPITAVIIFNLLVLTLSYREVVSVYTRAGGSYVVARENFGPRVAQVAAVALLIDYVLTVCVQTAAGTVAVVSAFPRIGSFPLDHYQLQLTLIIVLVIFYGNMRGIREAGRWFALPLYFFISMTALVIVVGVARQVFGHLPVLDPASMPGTFHMYKGSGFAMGASLFVLLRAFANGGSSLTGLEAISNGVSAFKPPEGVNARKTMVVMSITLGSLVTGVSWLAHSMHTPPFVSGVPSVISQEASLVFGAGTGGRVLFYMMQLATALVLYTGANTSFNGFPFLASFVAEDRFLPRQLTRRGHRLVFSNGIVVLTIASLLILIATKANVNNLVPFYAIGVFTGFMMAGFGMSKHHIRLKEKGWRHKLAINFTAGSLALVLVVIFAVTKWSEGAWIVLVAFPIMWVALIRLNKEYRTEAKALAALDEETVAAPVPNFTRTVIMLFVDELDLATVAAIRYARGLRGSELLAVHFAIDSVVADRLKAAWTSTASSIPLHIVDVPDRRLARAAMRYVSAETAKSGTQVTVVLPRRTFSPLLGRLLHDRTADKIARVVSRIPNAAATIVPFDMHGAAAVTALESAAEERMVSPSDVAAQRAVPFDPDPAVPTSDATPIGDLVPRQKSVVQGRIRSLVVRPLGDVPVLVVELADSTGGMNMLFYGRTAIPGLELGRDVRASGRVIVRDGRPAIINPSYDLLAPSR